MPLNTLKTISLKKSGPKKAASFPLKSLFTGKKESGSRADALKELIKKKSLPIKNLKLLDEALTHPSYSHEIHDSKNYERLEYLGDSVLNLIVNEYIFARHPDWDEGQMNRVKSVIVSEATLSIAGRELGLGDVLLLGKGEKNSGGRKRISSLADAFESVTAAIYLDQGMKAARSFVLSSLAPKIDSIKKPSLMRSAKSTLQELIQKNTKTTPVYEMMSETGPDHDKEFVCRVIIEGKEIARGDGSSKKRAEENAAQRALSMLEGTYE